MDSKSIFDRRLIHAFLGLSALGAVLLALALLLAKSAFADEGHDFVGYQKCKTCHQKEAIGNQFGVWLESRHAKAYETLGTEKAKKWGAEAGVDNPQTDDRCIKCHSTAHGVPNERVSNKFDRTAGVQCESCHGAGKDYRKKKIMMDREKAIAKGLIIPTAELCTGCHNDESPAWDEKAYTLADGSTSGFDFEQAVKKIAHPIPEGYDPAATGEAD
ncbi:MAG: cytochrome c family protein [Deltaproteobacteria bacterium]|nr:cytochrome c family protein [Deltaproteobacteria bacterium]